MFVPGNIKAIGSFFATEHINRVFSEASFVQLQNGGLQFFRGANNSYKFVRGIAQKIVIFVQVRVFQERLLDIRLCDAQDSILLDRIALR